jgi:hypothetical protein
MGAILFALIALASFTVHHFDETATDDILASIEEKIDGECEYVEAANKDVTASFECEDKSQKVYSFDLKIMSLEEFAATGTPCSAHGTLKRGLVSDVEISCDSHLVSKREQ